MRTSEQLSNGRTENDRFRYDAPRTVEIDLSRRVFILVLLDLFMHHHNTCVGGIGRRYRTGAIGYLWPYRIGAMHDRGYELPRGHLLRC
jgi:hypothetical protein